MYCETVVKNQSGALSPFQVTPKTCNTKSSLHIRQWLYGWPCWSVTPPLQSRNTHSHEILYRHSQIPENQSLRCSRQPQRYFLFGAILQMLECLQDGHGEMKTTLRQGSCLSLTWCWSDPITRIIPGIPWQQLLVQDGTVCEFCAVNSRDRL